MKKVKKIAIRNLPFRLSVSQFVSFWFLWDKFPREWARTILVIVYGLLITLFIISTFVEESVDIFKKSSQK